MSTLLLTGKLKRVIKAIKDIIEMMKTSLWQMAIIYLLYQNHTKDIKIDELNAQGRLDDEMHKQEVINIFREVMIKTDKMIDKTGTLVDKTDTLIQRNHEP